MNSSKYIDGTECREKHRGSYGAYNTPLSQRGQVGAGNAHRASVPVKDLWVDLNRQRSSRDFWRGVRGRAFGCAVGAFAVWLVFAIIQGVGVWL